MKTPFDVAACLEQAIRLVEQAPMAAMLQHHRGGAGPRHHWVLSLCALAPYFQALGMRVHRGDHESCAGEPYCVIERDGQLVERDPVSTVLLFFGTYPPPPGRYTTGRIGPMGVLFAPYREGHWDRDLCALWQARTRRLPNLKQLQLLRLRLALALQLGERPVRNYE